LLLTAQIRIHNVSHTKPLRYFPSGVLVAQWQTKHFARKIAVDKSK
jgi:hypothetical protein